MTRLQQDIENLKAERAPGGEVKVKALLELWGAVMTQTEKFPGGLASERTGWKDKFP